jgi:hypothetical protein
VVDVQLELSIEIETDDTLPINWKRIRSILRKIYEWDHMNPAERERKYGRGWAWCPTNWQYEIEEMVGEAEASRLAKLAFCRKVTVDDLMIVGP